MSAILRRSSIEKGTFYVPTNLRNIPLERLEVPASLLGLLKNRGFSEVGDFDSLSHFEFRRYFRTLESPTSILLIIEHAIQRLRTSGEQKEAQPIRSALAEAEHRTDKHASITLDEKRAPPTESCDTIYIPDDQRGHSLTAFKLSVRLQHVLENAQIRLLGQLHGRTFGEVSKIRNCGNKTIRELRQLVRAVQDKTYTPQLRELDEVRSDILNVSEGVKGIRLHELPMSVRLANALQSRGCKTLGDVHGTNVTELLEVENCGRKTIAELRQVLSRAETGEFTADPSLTYSKALGTIIHTIDRGIARLSPRDREIVNERLFGNEGMPRMLEDVGSEFGMTRERVRQIVRGAFRNIMRSGGPVLACAIEVVADDCNSHLTPLTVSLLNERLKESNTSGERDELFYVVVLDHMAQSIPAWPPGPTREGAGNPRAEPVQLAMEKWLGATGNRPTAKEAWDYLYAQPSFGDLSSGEFLTILRQARNIIVEFARPDEPRLRLRRLRLFDVVLPILNDSSEPLRPKEIMERASARFGADGVMLSARTAENALAAHPDLFRLGPLSFGLRKHFASSQSEWPPIRDHFAALLKKENRPISTIEVYDKRTMGLPAGVNSYELAEILREDRRFIDLGRRLFALAKWGIEEREHIKDLLPKILSQANRPLTTSEIYDRLTKFRSATQTGLTNILRHHPHIVRLEFEHYGLRAWGDSRDLFFIGKRALVERAIRRVDPPISFTALCELFRIPAEGSAADTLWKNCAGSEKLRRAPDRRSPDTLLMHKAVSLEQAIASIARVLGRPAPAYELEWELRTKFGGLFDRSQSMTRVHRSASPPIPPRTRSRFLWFLSSSRACAASRTAPKAVQAPVSGS